jgi:curved DNA-binding protein CbpA
VQSTAVRVARRRGGADGAPSPKDFYEVLGVKRDASKAEIADAFRALALRYHPDRNNDREAAAAFSEISLAYAVLSDDEERGLYDALGPDRHDDPWEVYRHREEAVRDAKALRAGSFDEDPCCCYPRPPACSPVEQRIRNPGHGLGQQRLEGQLAARDKDCHSGRPDCVVGSPGPAKYVSLKAEGAYGDCFELGFRGAIL